MLSKRAFILQLVEYAAIAVLLSGCAYASVWGPAVPLPFPDVPLPACSHVEQKGLPQMEACVNRAPPRPEGVDSE